MIVADFDMNYLLFLFVLYFVEVGLGRADNVAAVVGAYDAHSHFLDLMRHWLAVALNTWDWLDFV